MTYILAAYFVIAGELHRRELAAGLTYQQCTADLAAMPSAPAVRLACETDT